MNIPKKILRYRHFILLVILLLASYLRVSGLYDQGLLSHDEAFIINRAMMLKAHLFSSSDSLRGTETYVDSKILWIYLIILSQHIFSDPVLSGYFLSLSFALVTIVLTYLFGKYISRSTILGLFSALILAILPSHICYSRMALPETASGALALMSVLFYLHGMKHKAPQSQGVTGWSYA